MKLVLINIESIKKISNKELISIHRRTHQLIVIAKTDQQKKFLKKVHKIVIDEMKRRKFQHYSALKHGDNNQWQT